MAWLSQPLERRPDVSNPSSSRRLRWTSVGVACLTVGIAGCMLPDRGDSRLPVRTQEPVNPQAKTMAEFQQDVKAYIALQQKLGATLPPLPPDPTPEQIDARQRALADLIRAARKDASAGDLFDPEMQKVVRDLLRQIFSGTDGAELRAELMDENPGRIRITINGRYPDAVPLSTVPPQLLKGLPKLPPAMEYRFIGRALILFDSRSHLILDIMENAVP